LQVSGFESSIKRRASEADAGSRMKKIKRGYIFPSAAFTVPRNRIRSFIQSDKKPAVGDLIYGTIAQVVQHVSLENKEGRIHSMNEGTRAIFVLGNRYAPDYYEGVVPDEMPQYLDLLARSGVVGVVKNKNSMIKDPTKVKVSGYICDADGKVLNTRDFNLITPKSDKKIPNRARMILIIGTSMNCGKSVTAAACCWALSTMGHTVRGAKVTGTASLKDILLMEDSGASPVADFSFMGYPSTYLLDLPELLRIFNTLDLKYANSPKNYWVVELADGVLQRETAMLLRSKDVLSRVYKIIFNAADAFSAIGGLDVLKKEFDLVPDAISGICAGSPLAVQELRDYTDLPIFNSVQRNLNELASIIL